MVVNKHNFSISLDGSDVSLILIENWCRNSFGQQGVNWYWAFADSKEAVFYFDEEEKLTLFALRWAE